MRRMTGLVTAVALVLVCSLALAVQRTPAVHKQVSATKSRVGFHLRNAILPPKSMRNAEDMKHPALLSVAWQVHKVIEPMTQAGINVVVRDFEAGRGHGGVSVLTPASIAVTEGLCFSVIATSVAKELSQPLTRRVSQMAQNMPPVVKRAAGGMERIADTLVLKADSALRQMMRGR